MAQDADRQADGGPAQDGSCLPGDGARRCAGKWLAVGEFALVLAIFLADWYGLVPFSKTPFLLVLGWVSLRLRKVRWKDIGLTRFRSWGATLAYGVGAGLGMELLQLFVSQPLLMRLTGEPPNLEVFRSLEGNFRLLLILVPLVWVLAAFGEEMVFRGYLMNRAADLGNQTRWAWLASLVLVNILFGLAHAYQGITGIVDEGLMGLLLGLMYLGCGCNLTVPIVAHGVADTVDMVLIFCGAYPTM
jgi:membrane protease YdiL (CAAX protease family)